MSSATTIFAFPFAEAVLFLMVLDHVKIKNGPRKVYLISLLAAGAFMVVVPLRSVLILVGSKYL